jgi:hypothetical protein
MRLFTSALCTAVAVGLLAGCSGSNIGPSGSSIPSTGSQPQGMHALRHAPLSLIPAFMRPAGVRSLHLGVAPLKKSKVTPEFWASEFYGSQFFGYPSPNTGNSAPTCTVGTSSSPVEYVNGTGADASGNYAAPGYTGQEYLTVNVYKAGTCGTVLYDPEDETGQPAAVASTTSFASQIVIGELADYDNSDYGAVVICTTTACGTPLTSSNITDYGAGVAVDKSGDCWMSAETSGDASATLAYWPKCTGSGETATGFQNKYYGGLFIDTKGHLGAIDLSGTLYVYSGCNTACTLVKSTALHGESLFGNLNAKGNQLVVGDFENGACDVYTYNSKTGAATYSYSFDSGLTSSDDVESCISSPSNKKT